MQKLKTIKFEIGKLKPKANLVVTFVRAIITKLDNCGKAKIFKKRCLIKV
jgi:hypothetical protein